MKVALLSFDFAEYCVQLANGLVRQADVLLMLPADDARECTSALDPAVRYRPFAKPRLRQPWRQLAGASRLLRRVRKFRPDVVHFQHGHLWFNFALPLLRSYPLTVTVHDPRGHVGDRTSQKTPEWVMRFGYRRADRLIVHGEALRRPAAAAAKAPAEKVHSIPHIAIGRRDVGLNAGDQSTDILFFGRIWKYKGLEYLIRAEPAITRAIPGARIVIAGEGEDLGPYRRQMVHPERFVVHNRYVTASERDDLFARAAVVVLPYVEATQSGVVPVAYSFGKPVVATRVGALSEAVDDGETGLLVPPRDPQALAAAVIQLLSDSQRLRQMGLAGRRKLDAESAPEIVAELTMEVYREAVRDRFYRRAAGTRSIRSKLAFPGR